MKKFVYDDKAVVRTTAGRVHGYYLDGIYIFKGIPYAKAERFQAPESVEPWEGVRETTSYGYVCPLLEQDVPGGELFVPHRYWPMDENCQNLNIWTPGLGNGEKKPVLVWLHGGAFVAGSAIEQKSYDGFNICKKGDVLMVSVNHRLNILGYFDMSSFGEKYKNSANAGHADIVAALRWIRENIEAFGGDPENVTVVGQSGGGMKSSALMRIPEADSLFHKVFIMSGVSDGTLLPTKKKDGKAIVRAVLEALGISENEVEKLEKVPYRDFANAYNKVSPDVEARGEYVGCVPMPGEFWHGEVLEGLDETGRKIPIVVGSTYAEFAGFERNTFDPRELSDERVEQIYKENFGENAEKLLEIFKKTYPNHHPLNLLVIDRLFREPSKKLALQHAGYGEAKAYLYVFALDFPYHYINPAWHCADIPFFLSNVDKVESANIPEVSERLEKQMSEALISFAYTGSPSTESLYWPPCEKDNAVTMVFDEVSYARQHFDDELLELFNKAAKPLDLEEIMGNDIQH